MTEPHPNDGRNDTTTAYFATCPQCGLEKVATEAQLDLFENGALGECGDECSYLFDGTEDWKKIGDFAGVHVLG